MKNLAKLNYATKFALVAFLAIAVQLVAGHSKVGAVASCPAAPYGTVTQTLPVPTAGNYMVWARILRSDATNNSFVLKIDNTCYTVTATDANWDWVSSTTASVPLTAGSHNIVLLGTQPNVGVDRLIFTPAGSGACTPTGLGDNCVPSGPAPVVDVTAPSSFDDARNAYTLKAHATIGSGSVDQVTFKIDSGAATAAATSTGSGNYTLSFDFSNTTTYPNRSIHTITAVADGNGQSTSSDAVTFYVNRSFKQADLDQDGCVDAADHSTLILPTVYGKDPSTLTDPVQKRANLNGDNIIDAGDNSIMILPNVYNHQLGSAVACTGPV